MVDMPQEAATLEKSPPAEHDVAVSPATPSAAPSTPLTLGQVLDLALPAVAEQLLNMMVGLVDTFLVGHLGAASLAAVGLSNNIVMLAMSFFAAVATGTTALVARHVGGASRRAPTAFCTSHCCSAHRPGHPHLGHLLLWRRHEHAAVGRRR